MPLTQLHVVEKIKYLVSSVLITKKQIVRIVEKNAKDHHLINQRQENDDKDRIKHAKKELQQENMIADSAYARALTVLVISVFINFIFLVVISLMSYFMYIK